MLRGKRSSSNGTVMKLSAVQEKEFRISSFKKMTSVQVSSTEEMKVLLCINVSKKCVLEMDVIPQNEGVKKNTKQKCH